jgi:hypothetical protein
MVLSVRGVSIMWGFAWQNLITRPSRTALAVVGLTIPVLAFLGLFSISRGIRDLVGGTLATMQGLMVLRENSPSPVFSDLPGDMAPALRKIPGVRVVAPEVWKIAPPIDGRGVTHDRRFITPSDIVLEIEDGQLNTTKGALQVVAGEA